MRIVTWNVNGLRAARRSGAMEAMDQRLRPDILCLQETRADLAANETLREGMERRWGGKVVYSTNPSQPGYSGTLVCGHEALLSAAPRRDLWLYEDEGRVASATVTDAFVLMSVYAPNTGREERVGYKLQFLSRLGDEVAWLRKSGHVVVLAGDFNVVQDELDVYDWRGTRGHAGNREEEQDEWLAFLQRRNTNHVDAWRESHPGERQYTWWDMRTAGRRRGRGWRIDTFVVDSALVPLIAECTIHDTIQGSDHCPVTLDME